MKCPECATEVTDRQKFCKSCGFPLEELQAQVQEPEVSTRAEPAPPSVFMDEEEEFDFGKSSRVPAALLIGFPIVAVVAFAVWGSLQPSPEDLLVNELKGSIGWPSLHSCLSSSTTCNGALARLTAAEKSGLSDFIHQNTAEMYT
ncbi:MAG: zinc-ribbon domain-containing protein, partial [Bradymonadaceae bacterium]